MLDETWMPNIIDFDAEGRKLWEKLNLDPNSKGSKELASIDAIFKHPTGGGTIYVGGASAAKSLKLLKNRKITSIVNCAGIRSVPNYHEGTLRYYEFPIAHWRQSVTSDPKTVLEFTKHLFDYIDETVLRGESVLVHCLAGAHRAGTTGCACLVHYAGLEADAATQVAQYCRPIIEPIGDFPDFLVALRKAEKKTGRTGVAVGMCFGCQILPWHVIFRN